MAEVDPRLLPKQDCPCPKACGKFGMLTKGTGHVRGCPCPKCLGGRNRRGSKAGGGIRGQREFQKAAGIRIARHRASNGNEENWQDAFRWEHKGGKQVAPIIGRYLDAKTQSEASRAFGDHRPFAMGASHENVRLVIVEAEVWREHIAPLIEEVA